MFKVYLASKLRNHKILTAIREEWHDIEITSSWMKDHYGQVPDEPAFAKLFWQVDEHDVLRSDVTVVYTQPEDELRGALVEAGIALGSGKPVITVGDGPSLGTWSYHPRVYRVGSWPEAKTLLDMMKKFKDDKENQELWQSMQ